MAHESTVKFRPRWKLWIPLVLFLAPLILETQMTGTYFTPYLYSIFLLIMGIIYYFRIRLWESVLVMGMTGVAISYYFLAARQEESIETFQLIGLIPSPILREVLHAYFREIAFIGVLVINGVVYYTVGKKFFKAIEMEGNAIRLFKLAAREVSEITNGFTGRPFHAGTHNFEKNQIMGLSSYLEDKKICKAVFHREGVKLVFSMGISPLNHKQLNRLSYVEFSYDGKMTVFISEMDYRRYKRQFSFNQLCELMGKTFMRFADYYAVNSERMILTELRSV